MDEAQQELILKLTRWLNTQEGGWNAHHIDVTCLYFSVTDAAQSYQILKGDDDGSFYVVPL